MPNGERCLNSTNEWPPSLVPWHFGSRNQSVVTVRRALVDQTGPRCAICRVRWATVIDHDHLTGLARGYMCTGCNGIVDHCTDVSGCAFADYLNDPPGAKLALEYPNHKTALRKSGDYYVRRVEHFDKLVAEVADRSELAG